MSRGMLEVLVVLWACWSVCSHFPTFPALFSPPIGFAHSKNKTDKGWLQKNQPAVYWPEPIAIVLSVAIV